MNTVLGTRNIGPVKRVLVTCARTQHPGQVKQKSGKCKRGRDDRLYGAARQVTGNWDLRDAGGNVLMSGSNYTVYGEDRRMVQIAGFWKA
jgi:hypothetical protein